LNIRGLESTSERHVQCGLASANGPTSVLNMEHSSFTSPGGSTAIELQQCSVALRVASMTAGGVTLVATQNDATFEADQLRVRSTSSNSILGAGSRSHLKITNSTFEATDIGARAQHVL
jgi:hypothetical protein